MCTSCFVFSESADTKYKNFPICAHLCKVLHIQISMCLMFDKDYDYTIKTHCYGAAIDLAHSSVVVGYMPSSKWIRFPSFRVPFTNRQFNASSLHFLDV